MYIIKTLEKILVNLTIYSLEICEETNLKLLGLVAVLFVETKLFKQIPSKNYLL